LRHVQVREPAQRGQHLYPLVSRDKRLKGVITRKQLRELIESPATGAVPGDLPGGAVVARPVVASPDEPLRAVVLRMADTGFTRLPVVERDSGILVGMVSLHDLLLARVRNLNEERHRERVLRLRFPFGPDFRRRRDLAEPAISG
jgi:CIC family chloride channel protein